MPASQERPHPSRGVRLNRFLAQCGLGSRRACDVLIQTGHVSINGDICVKLGTRVQPGDDVRFDNKKIAPREELTILLNKPAGVLCTASDPDGRKTIFDLLPPRLRTRNLHHAGRLDRESEGLLVMTNSGDLSNALTHPRNKIEKEYIVALDRMFDFRCKRNFLEGIDTPEGVAKAISVEGLSRRRLRVVLGQGLKRQIRHMFDAFDYKVKRLERVRIGELTDPGLVPGAHRKLGERDIARLLGKSPTRTSRARQ